jgi:hypothetical protein
MIRFVRSLSGARRFAFALSALLLTVLALWSVALAFTFTTRDYPNSISTAALAIDSHDDIVGYYFDQNAAIHGFLRDKTGAWTSFDYPTADTTYATGVNNKRVVVGYYSKSGGPSHGYLRDKSGNYTPLDYPGATATLPQGINGKGEIVGYYGNGFTTRGSCATARAPLRRSRIPARS